MFSSRLQPVDATIVVQCAVPVACFAVCVSAAAGSLRASARASRKPPSRLATRIDATLSEPGPQPRFLGHRSRFADRPARSLYAAEFARQAFHPRFQHQTIHHRRGLALIGPDYQFHTTVETNGTLDKHGRLTGDLVLVGRGDPNLSGRELALRAAHPTQRSSHPGAGTACRQAGRRKGVKFVDGDIVADDSYFAFERYGEGWSQDDLVWADGAPVSALTINDNVIFVNILPADRAGERAFVSIMPFADYYRIDNRIMTTPAGTGRKIFINREPGLDHPDSLGQHAARMTPAPTKPSPLKIPPTLPPALFRHLLEIRGVVVYGKQRTRHTELASLSTFT